MKQIQYLDLMRYFVNHYDNEYNLLQAIEGDSANKLDLFITFKNSYMSVGRNFKNGNNEEIFADVLAFNDFEGNYVRELSDNFKNKGFLSKGNALSAASKFLWLRKRETIIIDTNNMNALKVWKYDYELYCKKWRQRYSQCRNQIIEITDKHFLENIDPIFGKEWFRMRVFDQFLWSLAKEK